MAATEGQLIVDNQKDVSEKKRTDAALNNSVIENIPHDSSDQTASGVGTLSSDPAASTGTGPAASASGAPASAPIVAQNRVSSPEDTGGFRVRQVRSAAKKARKFLRGKLVGSTPVAKEGSTDEEDGSIDESPPAPQPPVRTRKRGRQRQPASIKIGVSSAKKPRSSQAASDESPEGSGPSASETGNRVYRYFCWHCHISKESVAALLAHVKREHQESQGTANRGKLQTGGYPCEFCDLRFSLPSKLKAHVLSMHGETQSHECPMPNCDKAFKYPAQVRRHVMQDHDLDDKTFPCEQCDAVFKREDNRNRHVRDQHEPSKANDGLECEHCGKTFQKQFTLRIHVRKFHALPHECAGCKKFFATRRLLRQHMTKDKCSSKRASYTGAAIRKANRTKNGSGQDMKPNTDSDRFPFSCDQCGALFQQARECKIHVTKVHCERTLQCPVCDQWFKTAQHLRRHYDEQHGLESAASYPCVFCNKVFKRKRNMDAHVRDAHYEAPPLRFQCPVCGQMYTKMDTLNYHRDEMCHWPEVGVEQPDDGVMVDVQFWDRNQVQSMFVETKSGKDASEMVGEENSAQEEVFDEYSDDDM